MNNAVEEANYEVFAREGLTEQLYHVGSVQAPSIPLAEVLAMKIYDEHPWSELCLVPRDCITALIGFHDHIGVV